MPVIEESVEIRREPAEVFDFLVVAENIPVWDSSVVEAKQESERSARCRHPRPGNK